MFAETSGDVFDMLVEGVSEISEAETDYMDEILDPVVDDLSVPCEPGAIWPQSRAALEEMLMWTPADLRGTAYRSVWFSVFPQARSFPEGLDASGILYRWSKHGTVGKVRSLTGWPIWANPLSSPTSAPVP